MIKIIINFVLLILISANTAAAQTAEIKISLNEQFFDALLESIFKDLKEPKISLAQMQTGRSLRMPLKSELQSQTATFRTVGFKDNSFAAEQPKICDESIRLLREINGVRTAVRFRQGKIYVPLAFSGNYNPPLVGCINFQGWAETNIDLVFDKNKQALVGNAKVLKVNLNGTGGLGGEFLAKIVQSAIDRKINPIEIIKMDKISFTFPIQDSGSLRMRALGMRHKVNERFVDIFISYQFLKG